MSWNSESLVSFCWCNSWDEQLAGALKHSLKRLFLGCEDQMTRAWDSDPVAKSPAAMTLNLEKKVLTALLHEETSSKSLLRWLVSAESLREVERSSKTRCELQGEKTEVRPTQLVDDQRDFATFLADHRYPTSS